MARILPLPPDAISQIHSSKHITSLQGVVLSLLENSLDAGSSRVEISVDFSRGSCTIEDNGTGISPGELQEDGGLGKMYHTSKRVPSSDDDLHGSTGSYLASLAALSLLRVTCRHAEEAQHASLTIHQSKVVDRQTPCALLDSISLSIEHGTQVVVRDLFGNMPVRVKQRALAADISGEDSKAWQEVKRGIVALLLAWSGPCSVRLQDVNTEGRVLHLSSLHPSYSVALTKKSLTTMAGKHTKFELQDSLPMFLQAGLAPAESRSRWIPVSASMPKLAVKGSICLDPAPTKQCQFISIGIHPCCPSSGSSDMYEAVNKAFYNSSFGSMETNSDVEQIEKDRRKRDRRYKSDGYTQKQLRGRKGVDRWPMLMLQIRFKEQSARHVEPESLSDGNLKAVVEVLEATVTQWLAANHFRPRERKRRKNEEQQAPVSASQSDQCSATVSSPRPTNGTSSLHTPRLNRSTIRLSASTSRKRKFLDITGKVQNLPSDQLPPLSGGSGYFDSWSRIKSGRDAFYGELRVDRKIATAPADQRGTRASPIRPAARPAFNLPSVEIGELSILDRRSGTSDYTRFTAPSDTEHKSAVFATHTGSSDDFGDVGESDFLTVDELCGSAEDGGADGALNDTTRAGTALPETLGELSNDAIIDWVDPTTKQTLNVNARTGVVLPIGADTTTQNDHENNYVTPFRRQTAGINTSMSSAGRPLSLANRNKSASAPGNDDWLPGFLRDWNNPVFAKQDEEHIPIASIDGPGIEASEVASKRCSHNTRTAAFSTAGNSESTKLSKAALKSAKVIRQVDYKFILCKARLDETQHDELLLLVDQHAASERVILESLLAEICTPLAHDTSNTLSKVKTVQIEKPLRFQISAIEHRLFAQHRQHFLDWSIVYDLSIKDAAATASRVRAPATEHTIVVRSLPPGIAERCVLVPQLLIDLLRSEAWSVAESGQRPKSRHEEAGCKQSGEGGNPSWLNRIGSCPKGILDMLSSRACRSAIMFNDDLSITQCEELLAQLSDCAFPFMCAHGRVSLVPLVDTGKGGDGIRSTPFASSLIEEQSFPSAYRDWRANRDIESNGIVVC